MTVTESSKRKKVLVVDDDGSIVNLVDHALRLHHYEAVTATHWTDAMKDLEDEKPDLMLLDLSMPTVDGASLLEFIRRSGNRIPVIIISAHINGDTAEELLKLGVEALVPKPFDIHQIIGEIERVLGPPQNTDIDTDGELSATPTLSIRNSATQDATQSDAPGTPQSEPGSGQAPVDNQKGEIQLPRDEGNGHAHHHQGQRVRKLRKRRPSKSSRRRNVLYVAVTCVLCMILATTFVVTQKYFVEKAAEFNKQAKKSMAEQLLREIERAQEQQARNDAKENELSK
jgi:CheY-like chemotaxis protein